MEITILYSAMIISQGLLAIADKNNRIAYTIGVYLWFILGVLISFTS